MKRLLIGLCAATLVCGASLAEARECRKPGRQDGSYDGGRSREAAYDACMQREERQRQRREARRTARAPIDQSANAPPPREIVQPLQSK